MVSTRSTAHILSPLISHWAATIKLQLPYELANTLQECLALRTLSGCSEFVLLIVTQEREQTGF